MKRVVVGGFYYESDTFKFRSQNSPSIISKDLSGDEWQESE